MPDSVSIAEARRIALAAQGFDRARPETAITARHIRRIIRQLGLLQIDFVNVLVPAHYLVPFSRLGPYQRSLLDDLVYRRREFTEQWAREASIIPVETWPLLRHRMSSWRIRPWGFENFIQKNPAYVDWVLDQVRTRGALTADDLPDSDGIPRRLPGTWVGTVPRAVLEAHFAHGVLAIAGRRPNFARAYDLTERVLPPEHHSRRITPQDSDRELVRLAARAHGIATAADLADYYRMQIRDVRPRIAELVESGELREIRVESWSERAYLSKDARSPKAIEVTALISPFDPLVWRRDRAARLFGFDYRLEIFVPQQKRRWGYYVLPFLLGDRLVARVDLKADRAERRLLVLSAHLERAAGRDEVSVALTGELHMLARWLGLDSVVVAGRGSFARGLAAGGG